MHTSFNSTLARVRARIEERSQTTRAAYLASLPNGPAPRLGMGCANLAHTTAIFNPQDKKRISIHKAPHLGIVTAYNDMLSAHQPFAAYPQWIADIARAQGVTTQVAGGVPAMCDGITQGRAGMELSLFSRDVIALSACIGLSHDVFDAGILLGVCDKIAPGLLIGALAFGHLPFVFIPAGPMASGLPNLEKARVRQLAVQGKADRETLLDAEEASYHSSGTCTFYGTANSNQLMLDLMGLQFPGGAFAHPQSAERQQLVTESVQAIARAGVPGNTHLRLSQLVNAKSLVNALVGLMASGGSTNHTIHWVAVARAAGYVIDWTDMADISSVTPLLMHVYPNGTEDVNAFHAAGGTGYLIQTLIEGGFVDGSALTVWGTPLAETLRDVPEQSYNQAVLRAHDNPFQAEGGIRLLEGNLGRSVCKVSAVQARHRVVEAPCRVFKSQQAVIEAFEADELNQSVVVVVTHQGPHANGMPELHKLTPLLGVLQDKGFDVALVTDGRMSGASGKVLSAIHVSPEAMKNGPLGLLRDGDVVRVDAERCQLETTAKLEDRQHTQGQAAEDSLGRGYFNAWRKAVNSAEEGATHLFCEY